MLNKQLAFLSLLLPLASCQGREYRLKDMVNVAAIDSITIHNNTGDYRLKPAELTRFKRILGNMHYLPGASLKTGPIGFTVYVR